MSYSVPRISSPPPSYSKGNTRSSYMDGISSSARESDGVQELSDQDVEKDAASDSIPKRKFNTKSLSAIWYKYGSDLKFSHAWFLFFSLASMALVICVLASCRTRSEVQYSLLRITPVGSSSLTSEEYHVGLSGSCILQEGSVTCGGRFPFQLHKTEFDAAEPDVSDELSNAYIGYANKFMISIGSLLVASVLINTAAMIFSLSRESGSSKQLLWFIIPDTAFLIASGCLIGVAIPYSTIVFSGDPSIGIGVWLLSAAFGCRVISHYPLFLGCLILWFLPLILVGGFLVLICGDSDTNNNIQQSSNTATNTNDEGSREMMRYGNEANGIAGVRETTFVARDEDGNAIVGVIRSSFALLKSHGHAVVSILAIPYVV